MPRQNYYSRLLSILRDIGQRKILIFCATKKGCDVLQRGLEREGIRCLAIHGDKKQSVTLLPLKLGTRSRDELLQIWEGNHFDRN